MSKEIAIVRGDEHYDALIEECRSIITEKSFEANWTRIEMYHGIGEAIRNTAGVGSITKLLRNMSEDMQCAERTLWYAVQFYDQYPELDKLPEGKSASWTKIKQELPVNKRLEAPQVTDTNEIARGIFRKYGVEVSVEIVEELQRLIKENNEDF